MTDNKKMPGLITWSGYIAITLLLVLPLSILTVRSGAWQQGLLLYAIAMLGSVLLLILFVVLMMLPRLADWRAGLRARALATVPGTLAMLSLTLGGGSAPPIHDIMTDLDDPPTFATAAEQRGAGTNTLRVKPDEFDAHRSAYPDLDTLQTTLGIDEAFERAVQVAAELGWEVYHRDRDAGIIEAVETTSIMAFRDDVVIRVRGNAEGAYLDLRSVSRVGQGDIGANAERIRRFIDAFKAS
jgi:uncharacterized protein (DUF1499 family)